MHLHIFLSFFLLSGTLFAQTNCAEQLDRGKRLYELGQLEAVISTLSPCALDETTSRPVRREMMSLLQEAYLFLDQPQLADSIHLALLRLDPFFRQHIEVPEVRYLLEQYETYPIATYGIRLGIYSFTRPLIDRRFKAFPDLEIEELNYKRKNDDLYGWTVNVDISFNLLKSSVEIATGVGISNIYLRRNFQFANARMANGERGPATLSFLERQRWTQLPFLLKINGVPRSKIITSRFIPYFCIGGASELLIKHAAQAIAPEIDFTGLDNDRSASQINIGDQRKRVNFALLAGVGGKLRFKRSYLSLDIRYHRLLQNVTSDSNRFTNDEMINTFNYADNDFRLHNYNISAGVGIFLFRSKKR